MNGRGWTAFVATAVTGLLLAGCGVPGNTDVRVDGPMSEADSSEADEPTNPPPGPDQANSEEQLVEYFLQAAVADLGDPVEALGVFIHRDHRASWQPDPQILLVRADDPVATPGDVVRVQVDMRVIGVLGEGGVVEPRDQTRQLTFEVVEETAVEPEEEQGGLNVGGPRFRLVDPPDEIMLSTRAMEAEYLRPRTIYFWDNDHEVLVPDLRWLPSTLADRHRAQVALEWLEDGPAPWLQRALDGLDEVVLAGNVVWGGDRLDVPLTAAAGEVDGATLNAQLWWTLRPALSDGRALVVNIDGQTAEIGEEYVTRNPAVRSPPARFAVLDGVVHQQDYPGDGELDLPALGDDVNTGIQSAAMTYDRRSAALVRVEPDERLRLVVSRREGPVETNLVRSDMGRPVWLYPGDTGLVVADGKLYRFDEEGETASVDVPGLAEVAAVAADASGRRLALISRGRLYVASMEWRDGSFNVTEARALPTTAGSLSGVAFLQESWLTIVGEADGQTRLYEITVDGALEHELPNGTLGVVPNVDSFVAYPGDPTDGVSARGEIMYEVENRAYTYSYSRQPVYLEASDLYGDPPEEDAGDPRAPFFLD
jgi:hypothetical protein